MSFIGVVCIVMWCNGNTHIFFESYANGLWKGLPFEDRGVFNEQSWLFFWDGEHIFIAKDLGKVCVDIYMQCLCRRLCSKGCFPEKERRPLATPYTLTFVLPIISGPCTSCELEFTSQFIPGSFFFAKVLLKPWRKTTFSWKQGGLNCELQVTR